MFLFIARHAWAGTYGDPAWPNDSLRELTPDGIQRYRRVVQALSERGFAPEHIATSPLVRCRQTAEIIAEETHASPTLEEVDALAPGSDLPALIEWSADRTGDVCWVGHNPDVEWLTAALIGRGGAQLRFAKGSIAAVQFDFEPTPAEGLLYWHLTAKALGV